VFVSVNGSDANTCSNIATPCRTLGAGITQVDAQGEVIVIDTGSYAGATIAKSVKVNVAAGVVAFSGLAVTVDPGTGGVVVLRGLTLKAATAGTGTGISHQSGTLFVENLVVDGWEHGLVSANGAERLFVNHSVFRNQILNGLWVRQGSTATVSVDDSSFESNGYNPVYCGLNFQGGRGRVSNTVVTANGYGALVSNAGTDVTFQRCELSHNGLALYVSGGVLRVSESTVTRNGSGLVRMGGTLESFKNNIVRGNVSDTVGAITSVTLQ
jgi:hypothetical protein